MWIVIVFVCIAHGCGFIDSPPLNSAAECKTMLASGMAVLQADDTVIAFDGACIYVKMRQV